MVTVPDVPPSEKWLHTPSPTESAPRPMPEREELQVLEFKEQKGTLTLVENIRLATLRGGPSPEEHTVVGTWTGLGPDGDNDVGDLYG